ncbi:MAG: hypothetical protein O7C98_12490 [Planctomycetota bacterium]|nr:hypothetical protein [Planctomycetota bacterium]
MGGRVLLLLLCCATSAAAERAVSRDGNLLEGELVLSVAGRTLTKGKRVHSLDAFYLVEKDDGSLLWAPGYRARLRGYELLSRAQRRGTLLDLTKQALKAKNARLARTLFESAQSLGLSGSASESLERKIVRAGNKPRRPDSKASERIQREAAAAARLLPLILTERARKELAREGGDREQGLRLLREALVRAPAHGPANRLLRDQAPMDFTLGDPRFWLDWHLDLEARGAHTAPDGLELKRARHYWRPDLYGLRAGPILLVTPVKDTRVVGRCVATGRLTCKVLETLFATDTPREHQRGPLTILLYSSQKEYKDKLGGYVSREPPTYLERSAGHYSPSEQLSKFYWHESPDAERRIVGTCVHELTHHWIRERNPRYAISQVRRRGNQPGFWIVEGFATFMGEGRYDLDRGTWNLFNERSRSLDVVDLLASKKGLIPWERYYALSQEKWRELPHEMVITVTPRWSLRTVKYSLKSIFYKQAAATVHYLYHCGDPKLREALLDYVVNHYKGDGPNMDPKTAFGMSAAELGKQVEAFARKVAGGWRPK